VDVDPELDGAAYGARVHGHFPEPPHGFAYLIYQGHAYVVAIKRLELLAEVGHERDDPAQPVTYFRVRFLGQARRVATL
jgi:hypothetical protein